MFNRRGQSLLEYTILIGIVTISLFYMGTGIKRGLQSLVKVSADQIGNQQNADQDVNDELAGVLQGSNTQTNMITSKGVGERLYTTTINVANRLTNGN